MAAPGNEKLGVVSLVTLSVFDAPLSEPVKRSGADGADGADVSIATGSAGPDVDVLPAGSATVADTFHSPSAIAGRSQLFTDGDFTYVHVRLVLPALLAVIVTVLPSGTDPADIAGVLSLVRLSVADVPRSDADRRSGADGADGGVVSREIVRPPVGPAVFPAGSVAEEVIAQSPGASVPKSQLVTDGDFTYEQVTLELPNLLAVIVMVSPSTAPAADTVGVVSFVTLSVDDDPLSDVATRSGVPAVVDVSTVNGSAVDEFDTFPARSVCLAETLHTPSANVPRSHDDAFSTYEHDTSALPALLAVMVIVSPATPDTGVADIVGVLSFVRLSLVDVPVSDAVARSTAVGADGAMFSSVVAVDVTATPGPAMPRN